MSLREIGCSDRGTIRDSASFTSLTGPLYGNGASRAPGSRGSDQVARSRRKKRGPGRAEGLVPAPAPEGEEFCPSGPVEGARQGGRVILAEHFGAASLVVVMHVFLFASVPIDSSAPWDSTIRARSTGWWYTLVFSGLRQMPARRAASLSTGGDRVGRSLASVEDGPSPPAPLPSPPFLRERGERQMEPRWQDDPSRRDR